MFALKEVDEKKRHVHGGPIPPALYQIHLPATNKHVGLSALLEPLTPLPNYRGGFFIHARGPTAAMDVSSWSPKTSAR